MQVEPVSAVGGQMGVSSLSELESVLQQQLQQLVSLCSSTLMFSRASAPGSELPPDQTQICPL